MPTVYNTVYIGDFCDDKLGSPVEIFLSRRMDSGSPIPIPKRIIFAGRNNSPVKVDFKDDGDYKLVDINGSSCQLNIKAIDDFELASLYTADEKEWRLDLVGTFKWSGYLIPDSCIEPYASKPYDVSVRATDALGTLKDIPFLQTNTTRYIGFISDRELLFEILQKTGLRLPMSIAINTFESTMDIGVCPLSQNYINTARFYEDDGTPFNCEDVLQSILNRWSSRLHQFNGKWQIVNVLEKSLGDVATWEFDSDGNTLSRFVLGNSITVGGLNRTLQPTSANNSFAKALAQSTVYYQYGYATNQLKNGDFNDSTPPSLPNDWTPSAGFVGFTYFRVDPQTGITTDDVILVITSTTLSSVISNDVPVQVRNTEKVTISYEMNARDAASFLLQKMVVDVVVSDNHGKYFTNDGWQSTFGTYKIFYKFSAFENDLTVNFEVAPQTIDYELTIGLANVYTDDYSDQFETQINNVKIQPQVNPGLSKPPLGVIKKYVLKAPQSYKRDNVLLLHGDEYNDQRTSQISIGSATVITPPVYWVRDMFPTETNSLLRIVADSELRMHSRPYRIFEAEFVGTGYIDINTLLTVDLLEGEYIFLSGSFDLKRGIHNLRFAQVLTDSYDYYEEPDTEDYGNLNN